MWGDDVGDDLSFAMPNYCSAGRDDDPKKLSSAQQGDDVSSAGRPPWSDVVEPVRHRRDGEDRIVKILLILMGCV